MEFPLDMLQAKIFSRLPSSNEMLLRITSLMEFASLNQQMTLLATARLLNSCKTNAIKRDLLEGECQKEEEQCNASTKLKENSEVEKNAQVLSNADLDIATARLMTKAIKEDVLLATMTIKLQLELKRALFANQMLIYIVPIRNQFKITDEKKIRLNSKVEEELFEQLSQIMIFHVLKTLQFKKLFRRLKQSKLFYQ